MTDESEIEELRAQLETVRGQLVEEDQELLELKSKTADAQVELHEARKLAVTQVNTLIKELEILRAQENLRSEHQCVLEREEAERMETWFQDVNESHQREKAYLLDQVDALRSTTHRLPRGDSPASDASINDDPLPTRVTAPYLVSIPWTVRGVRVETQHPGLGDTPLSQLLQNPLALLVMYQVPRPQLQDLHLLHCSPLLGC